MTQKTVRYSGATPEEAQQRYSENSARAIAMGWRVADVQWDTEARQPTLSATYVAATGQGSSSPTVTPDGSSTAPETVPRKPRGTRRRGLWTVVGIVVLVVVAYTVLFEPERPTPLGGGPDGQVGKYEQTWATDYDFTTCADFEQRMNDHQRWVMAADYLLDAHRIGNPGVQRPPDSQVDRMLSGMDSACEGAGEEVGIMTTDVAATLYTLSGDLRPLPSATPTLARGQVTKATYGEDWS